MQKHFSIILLILICVMICTRSVYATSTSDNVSDDSHLTTHLGNIEKQFQDGVLLYSQKQYREAFDIWLKLAEDNYPPAQHNVSLLYKNGIGTTQNWKETLKWSWAAKNNGYIKAKNTRDHSIERVDPTTYKEISSWQLQYFKPEDITLMSSKKYAILNMEIETYMKKEPVNSYLWFLIAASFGDRYSIKTRDLLSKEITSTKKLLSIQEEANEIINNSR